MRRVPAALLLVCITASTAVGQAVPAPTQAPLASATSPVESLPTPTTRLYVRTIPAGAQVTLDGKPLGASDGLFLVPAGTAKVAVGFDGQEPEVRQVEIAEGRITRIEIQLGAEGVVGGENGIGSGGGIAGGSFPVLATGKLTSPRKLAQPPAPLTPIDDLLAKPVDLSFSEVSLHDVAAGIEQAVGCDVSFDRLPLDGVDLNEPRVATQSHRTPLASFLNRMLHDHDLDWTVQDGGIEITTREAASTNLFTHMHDVSDLCDEANELQTLIDVVTSVIAPETWEQAGGEGVISMDLTNDAASLVVRQTLAVQREITGFLDRLRRLESQPAGERQTLSAEGYWSDSDRTASIRRALEQKLKGKVSFDQKSLRDVVADLTEASGVPVVLDTRGCHDAGIDLDEPIISFTGRDLPLGRLLDRMLRDVAMAFVVEDDQIVVTTADAAAVRVSVAIYPIDRLLAKGRGMQGIVDMLQANVMPVTWEPQGGWGVVRPVDGDAPCLVVLQTTAGHRAVDAFLTSLR
ncbi:MAG: PEGA domain-containing protein [Pirellulales bacterium]